MPFFEAIVVLNIPLEVIIFFPINTSDDNPILNVVYLNALIAGPRNEVGSPPDIPDVTSRLLQNCSPISGQKGLLE